MFTPSFCVDYDDYDTLAFESAAQWIIALSKELSSGILIDIKMDGCKLELYFNHNFPRATLRVSRKD